jgi:hypothetical protein
MLLQLSLMKNNHGKYPMSSGNRHSRSYLKRNRTIIKNIREKQGAAVAQWNHAGYLKQFFSFSAQAFNGKHCQKRSALQARYTVISGSGAKKDSFRIFGLQGLQAMTKRRASAGHG